jgi:hypothetical protein
MKRHRLCGRLDVRRKLRLVALMEAPPQQRCTYSTSRVLGIYSELSELCISASVVVTFEAGDSHTICGVWPMTVSSAFSAAALQGFNTFQSMPAGRFYGVGIYSSSSGTGCAHFAKPTIGLILDRELRSTGALGSSM